MTVVIQVSNLNELEPIREWLAQNNVQIQSVQQGLPLGQPHGKILSQNEEEYSKQIVLAGCNASAFGDASEWQKDQRKERNLPWNI